RPRKAAAAHRSFIRDNSSVAGIALLREKQRPTESCSDPRSQGRFAGLQPPLRAAELPLRLGSDVAHVAARAASPLVYSSITDKTPMASEHTTLRRFLVTNTAVGKSLFLALAMLVAAGMSSCSRTKFEDGSSESSRVGGIGLNLAVSPGVTVN